MELINQVQQNKKGQIEIEFQGLCNNGYRRIAVNNLAERRKRRKRRKTKQNKKLSQSLLLCGCNRTLGTLKTAINQKEIISPFLVYYIQLHIDQNKEEPISGNPQISSLTKKKQKKNGKKNEKSREILE